MITPRFPGLRLKAWHFTPEDLDDPPIKLPKRVLYFYFYFFFKKKRGFSGSTMIASFLE